MFIMNSTKNTSFCFFALMFILQLILFEQAVAQEGPYTDFSEGSSDVSLEYAVEVAEASEILDRDRSCIWKYKGRNLRSFVSGAVITEYSLSPEYSVKLKISYYCVVNRNKFRRQNPAPSFVWPPEFYYNNTLSEMNLEERLALHNERLNKAKTRRLSGKSGCQTLGCYNETGIYWYEDGALYNGNSIMGKNNGLGVMFYEDGEKYHGFWRAGKKHGLGLMQWSDGEFYYGEWKDGKIEGYGNWFYADGSMYFGDFVNGKRQGNSSSYVDGKTWEIYDDSVWHEDIMIK